MNPKIIIICGGIGTRWGQHNGIDKHFARVSGEKLIERTLRLLKPYSVESINIIARPNNISNFLEFLESDRIFVFNAVNIDGALDANKFLSSRDLWNEKGRTIVLYGDVFFTSEAIDKIMTTDASWSLFGRAFGSEYTGKPYGECFAQSFTSESINEHHDALLRIIRLHRSGIINRCGGWEHYRAMINIEDSRMNDHLVGARFVNIDDFTDDFDSPEEYQTFIENYEKSKL